MDKEESRSYNLLREKALTKSYENTVTIPLNNSNRQAIYNEVCKISSMIADKIKDRKYESITVRRMQKGLMKDGNLVLHENDFEQKLDFSKVLPKISGKVSSTIYGLYEDGLVIL